ncbi:MAG TPA: hypothetical protein VG826_33145 [Pirellulales bacterium]|nr:hypothetical protein [Pirellulales bacterium]
MLRLDDLADMAVHDISESDYNHFRRGRESELPAVYRFNWNNHFWDFGCTDAYGFIYAFTKHNRGFLAAKTPLIDPRDIRIPIDDQVRNPASVRDHLRTRLSSMAVLWQPTWRRLAAALPELATAQHDACTPHAVTVCLDDAELIASLAANTLSIGDCLVREHVAFIKLTPDNSRWAVYNQATFSGTCDARADISLEQQAVQLLQRLRTTCSPSATLGY